MFVTLTSIVYAFVQQTLAKEADRRAMACEAIARDAEARAAQNLERAQHVLDREIKRADSVRQAKALK